MSKKTIYDIVRRPIITERSMQCLQEGKYVFRVAPTAGKIEIKQAIEKIFDVKVEKVNTMKVRGKQKRMGVHVGKTAASKKAIVKLKEGSKTITIFENFN